MGFEIIHATDLKRSQDFSALIYAQPGTGKTSTLKYLPGKTLVIDIDRTTKVLAHEANVDVMKMDVRHPLKGSRDLLKYVHDNLLEQYDNIALDNLSEFEQAWLGEKARESKTTSGKDMGVPQMNNYNQYTYFLPDMVRYINSWPNVNKIYTAWESTRQIDTPSGQTYTQFIPQIREKIVTNVMGLMNLVGRMVISDKTNERGFILAPSNAVYAKNQLDAREFSLQKDLFTKIGGAGNVSTTPIPTEDGKSSQASTSKRE